MAEGTRMKSLEELVRKTELQRQQINQFVNNYRQQFPFPTEFHDQLKNQQIQVAFPQENKEPSTKDLGKDSDAYNVFDKMTNEKSEARLNFGINSGNHENLGDSSAINWHSGNNSGQENGERSPSWYTVCKGELQANADLENLEEKYQEIKDQSYSPNSKFLTGNNQFSKLEIQLMDGICLSENMCSVVAHNGMGELMGVSFDPTGIGWNSFRAISLHSSEILGVHDMFDEMPIRSFNTKCSSCCTSSVCAGLGYPFSVQMMARDMISAFKPGRGIVTFDPGGIIALYADGLALFLNRGYDFVQLLSMFGYFFKSIDHTSSFTFDPGGILDLKITVPSLDSRGYVATVESGIVEQRLQWDPGGIVTWRSMHGTLISVAEPRGLAPNLGHLHTVAHVIKKRCNFIEILSGISPYQRLLSFECFS